MVVLTHDGENFGHKTIRSCHGTGDRVHPQLPRLQLHPLPPNHPTDLQLEETWIAATSVLKEAQQVLDGDRSDPHRLDGDGNGIACERLL